MESRDYTHNSNCARQSGNQDKTQASHAISASVLPASKYPLSFKSSVLVKLEFLPPFSVVEFEVLLIGLTEPLMARYRLCPSPEGIRTRYNTGEGTLLNLPRPE